MERGKEGMRIQEREERGQEGEREGRREGGREGEREGGGGKGRRDWGRGRRALANNHKAWQGIAGPGTFQ